MQIVLVRHTACAIQPGRCYGRLDLDLSAAGREALPSLVGRLRAGGIGRVVSSPARRCRALADQLGAPVVDPRLQELDFGTWEGRNWDDIPRDALDAWAADPLGFAPPGGETGAAFLDRVRAAAAGLRAAGEDCIVVTHGGPLRLLPAVLRGLAPDLLAPTQPLGSVRHVQLSTDSPAHSAATAQAPSTSPVNPPI